MASQRGAVLLVNGFYPKLYVLMCRGILVLRLPQLPSPLVQGPFDATVLDEPGSVYARDDRRSSLFPPETMSPPVRSPLHMDTTIYHFVQSSCKLAYVTRSNRHGQPSTDWLLVMLFIRTIALLGLVPSALAYPGRQQTLAPATSRPASPRPLVVWHGLGDTAASEGMASIKKDIEGMYPGIFVMNVKVPGEGSLDDERKAGFVSRLPVDQEEAA